MKTEKLLSAQRCATCGEVVKEGGEVVWLPPPDQCEAECLACAEANAERAALERAEEALYVFERPFL